MTMKPTHLLFRRIFLTAFMIAAVVLVVVNFYRFAASPTDENIFDDAPSQLYIFRSFPADISYYQKRDTTGVFIRDSVYAGDLLVSIGGILWKDQDSIARFLKRVGSEEKINAIVFRSKASKMFVANFIRKDAPDSFYHEIQFTAHVREVAHNGASDRAGMLVGDLIVRINGRTFKSAIEADRILSSGQIGKTIAYDILRDNQIITLDVTLAKFGIPFFLLVIYGAGLVYILVGSFLVYKRADTTAAVLLGMAFFLIGMMLSLLGERGSLSTTPFGVFVTNVRWWSLVLGMAMLMHSRLYFPFSVQELIQKKWVAIVPYGLSAITFIGIVVYKQALAAFVSGIAMMVYYIFIRLRYKSYFSSSYRSVSRLSGWIAFACAVLGYVLTFFSDGNSGRGYLFGYAGFFFALIPLAHLYTIARYHLMELNFRVRRNVQYVIASLVWNLTVVYGAVQLMVIAVTSNMDLPNIRFTESSVEITDVPVSADERMQILKVVLILLAVLMTFVWVRLRSWGQRWIDYKFHRSHHDYRRAAAELAEVMATNLNMNDLARGMVEKLASLMHLKMAGVVFYRDEKSLCCSEVYGYESGAWQALCSKSDQPLMAAVRANTSTATINVDNLPGPLRNELRQCGFRFVIPIRSKEHTVGAIIVGERMSESPFDHDDLMFLTTVAKQASVAIENAFLYENLAEQDRLKHELNIARRIQLESLPQKTPNVRGLEIAGRSVPALEVGGDYFDYLNGKPDKFTVIVGDVSGKGTSAALYMSKVQGIIHSLNSFDLTPRELFIRSNRILCRDLEKKSFVTSIGATFLLEEKKIRLARAGHLPLYCYNASQRKVELITPLGVGLGITDDGTFEENLEEKEFAYAPGDIFVFVTDGVIEAHNIHRHEYGEERLLKLIDEKPDSSAEMLVHRIIDDVHTFTGEAMQHDDETVVVIKAL